MPPESEPGHPVRLGPLIYAMTGPSEEVEIFEQDVQRAAALPGPEAFTQHGSNDFEWAEHVSQIIAAMQKESRTVLVCQLATTTLREGGRIIRFLSDDGQVDVCGVWRSQVLAGSKHADREQAFIERLLRHWADPASTDQISLVD